MITKIKKDKILAEYKEVVDASKALYLVNITGISASDVTTLRKKLKRIGANFYMVKNSMFKIALENAGLTEVIGDVVGQYGMVSATGDIVEPAKMLKEFVGKYEDIKPAFGVLDKNKISGEQITQLAELPDKDQLLGMLAGALVGVLRNTMSVLNGATRDFVQILRAREENLSK
ncbi:MAG TPA: 50S ribosomal protein L10 [Candidatus Dojkabacteria bacterium]|nr:50S ribosomal protein L10 [Candidatus Dojkabacteria bacterium]HQF36039.1 50S ribosomal protein L10 [Candidatus Dojkabacteria bacterium]